MGSEIVVFLGPSLDIAQARRHLDALYLPPAASGDIVRAVVDHAPRAIALIDGVFGQFPAVRHKEISWAISRGVNVYGSSSMGAIRAAEMAEYGMRGHGTIYRWYRRTPLADDADVAVAMAPAKLGSFALGDALIDMRLTLKDAARRGIIGRETQHDLARLARSIHHTVRSYPKLLSLAAESGLPATDLAALQSWIANNRRKQKEVDAIGLLSALSSPSSRHEEPRLDQDLALTEAFAYDMEYYGLSLDILRSNKS